MTLYHPGKVVAVYSTKSKDIISSGKDVQVLIEMWDDNLFTCDVSAAIADKISEEDVVLVDYSPISAKITAPKHVVVKILRGKTAEKTWDKYRSFYHKRKNENQPKPPQPPMQLYG